MPQPYKPPDSGGRTAPSHKVLLSRPECAIRIAMIASASAEIEDELARLVAIASGTIGSFTRTENSTMYSAYPNRVAAAALDALESMRARIAVVKAVLEISVSKPLRDEFAEIAESVGRAAGTRNRVVHCVWTIHPSKPNDLLQVTETGDYVRYTARDFDDILSRLNEEIFKLQDFKRKCAEDRHARGV